MTEGIEIAVLNLPRRGILAALGSSLFLLLFPQLLHAFLRVRLGLRRLGLLLLIFALLVLVLLHLLRGSTLLLLLSLLGMGTLDTLREGRVKASGVDVTVDVVSSGNAVLVADTATFGAGDGLSMMFELLGRWFRPKAYQ